MGRKKRVGISDLNSHLSKRSKKHQNLYIKKLYYLKYGDKFQKITSKELNVFFVSETELIERRQRMILL